MRVLIGEHLNRNDNHAEKYIVQNVPSSAILTAFKTVINEHATEQS